MGKCEAFVSLVSEAVPDILTDRQMRLLTLGLRAKMMLQMLSSEQSEDLSGVKTYMNSLLSSSSEQVHKENEALEINFVRLVQRLLDDPKDREHFLESVFPVEYGPDFDAALETVVCEFFTRLEALLLIPDFKQTAVWISDAPSVLEDFMQAESTADDLKVLLRSDALRVHTTKTDSSGDMETQDGGCPSEEDTNIQDSSKAEQTAGGKCSDSIRVGKKVDNGASDTCRAPSTSNKSPAFRSCVTVTPWRRVLYRCTYLYYKQ
ncbi:uncharacterized protein LOC121951181 [Plectropomus leopardus]|uniref:uncharacterized protein LOC121951181 n=1 Tax=Plectropomus leopardus TaxID=160734 RepID=UPI001C4DD546|nr:uncharacterized protein LOC121951181 [Plectropomus leopardus]